MSHLWGLDAAYPPSQGGAQGLKNSGWSFFGGYIGGHAEHVWSKDDFVMMANTGFQMVAYWVGPLGTDPGYEAGVADGNACLVAMQERGLSGYVWDDAESGVVRRNWSQGFVDALHAGSCQVGVYGTTDTLNGMGDLYDTWYLAAYPQPMESLNTWNKRIIDWDHWQVSDGPDFDYNCAISTAPFTTVNTDGS